MIELGKSTEPERGRFAPLFFFGVMAGVGLLLSQFAFTSRVRHQILERDGYHCVEEGNGPCIGGLEASHIDHNRDNGAWYNNPDNGLTLCTRHHYYQHIREEGRNGLIKKHNKWAIQRLKERLMGYIGSDIL